ncbi:D-amino acid dehydrogenase 2 small subunit [Candidatus Propionivibrio aalborgensis]|uniref:D-amino acid dehydrogenase 2 small subunit n=2 Tax=Candidatus Propionivibrio aalborgensis TaxID=1860101 RepID=A0A1A8Y170_9RHOO|nr:D-amino acid dehydrogenase 2 small subunit [Candidatus Propionivibrio aalborgensis]
MRATMHITVLGAGIAGLTTAWYLVRDGHAVEVVERNSGVALEASFANGAQLSYSYVAPLAGPSVLPKVPPWLLRRDAPLRFYPAFDTRQWRWLLEFVLACRRGTSELTTQRLLSLSFYSRALMHRFVSEEDIDFGYARTGKLVLYSAQADFDGARRLLDFQRSLGCEQDALDRAQCVALEPMLGDSRSLLGRRIVGGIRTVSEEVGDCYRFSRGLEEKLRAQGVVFHLGSHVTGLETRGGRITAVNTATGSLPTDLCVMTLGAQSPVLSRTLGFRLPIYPLKGYSLTLPPRPEGASLGISITDATRKVVYAPLADASKISLRVAGMADISGYSNRIDPVRVKQLFLEAERAFPAATDYAPGPDAMQPWTGLRPATPKGMPILGASPFPNLFLNCGHGALGWTLALGSARILADLIKGATPEIALAGFTLPR